MVDQTTPGAAAPAPAAGAQSDPSFSSTSAAVAELTVLRAKTPGIRFNRLPPSVSALLDGAAPTNGAPPQAGTGAQHDPNAQPGAAQDPNAPAEAAAAHDVSAFAGDNDPVSDIDAMQARIGLAHQLQVADEIPGLDAGVANEYGKQLAAALQNPPTRAQKLEAMSETARTLQWRYPNGQDKKVLADAQAELKLLAARIPELPGLLERTGGGNDVGVIIRLAERHAQRAGARIASAARGAARR